MIETEPLLDIWMNLKEIGKGILNMSSGEYEDIIDCEKLFFKLGLNSYEKILLTPQSKICIMGRDGYDNLSIMKFELISSFDSSQKIQIMEEEKCYRIINQIIIHKSDRIKIVSNKNIEDFSIKIDADKTRAMSGDILAPKKSR